MPLTEQERRALQRRSQEIEEHERGAAGESQETRKQQEIIELIDSEAKGESLRARDDTPGKILRDLSWERKALNGREQGSGKPCDDRYGNLWEDIRSRILSFEPLAPSVVADFPWNLSPKDGLRLAQGWCEDAMRTGGTPPHADVADQFPPLAWMDERERTYKFSRPLLWQLWRALVTAGRRLTYAELPTHVEQWKDASLEDATVETALKDLKKFWRKQDRRDLADGITRKAGTIGFEMPNP